MRKSAHCHFFKLSNIYNNFHQCTHIFRLRYNNRYFHCSSIRLEEDKRSTSNTIKSKILQLYKLTHPDLFRSHPAEQKINQQSLQLFQNFLDEYKGFITASNQDHLHHGIHISANRYNLHFFTHQNDREGFNNVKVTIRGPPPNCSIIAKSNALSKNLQELFFAIGLSSHENNHTSDDVIDYIGKKYFEDVNSGNFTSPSDPYGDIGAKIINFVRENFHKHEKRDKSMAINGVLFNVDKQAEVLSQVVRNKISSFLGAFMLTFDIYHGLHVKQWEIIEAFRDEIGQRYGIDTSHWGMKERFLQMYGPVFAGVQKPVDEKRPNELAYVREILSSLRIVISTGPTRVHGLGHVVLDVNEDAKSWLDFIVRDLDRNLAMNNVREKEKYLEMERMAAKKLNIHKFISENDNVFLNDSYRKLLEQICTMEKPEYIRRMEDGKIPPEYAHITVVIQEPESNDIEIKIHERYGYILATYNCKAHQIFGMISVHGRKAGLIHQKYEKNDQNIHRMLKETRQYLGLHHLECVSSLEMVQVLECCEKLVAARDALKPILASKSICISDGFNIRIDGTIEIPYNF